MRKRLLSSTLLWRAAQRLLAAAGAIIIVAAVSGCQSIGPASEAAKVPMPAGRLWLTIKESETGKYVDFYLYAADPATVRDALMRAVPNGTDAVAINRGQWKDLGMPLKGLDRDTWLKTALLNRPETLAALTAARRERISTTLRDAVAAGAMTPSDADRLLKAAPDPFDYEGMKAIRKLPLAGTLIPIWRYTRAHGGLLLHDELGVMDVSPLMGDGPGRGPLTLVWFEGSGERIVGAKLSLSQCMTGVTCIFLPSIDPQYEDIDHLDAPIAKALTQLAATQRAADQDTVSAFLRGFIENDERLKQRRGDTPPAIKTVDGMRAPLGTPRIYDLPTNERQLDWRRYDNHRFARLVVLPDGSVFYAAAYKDKAKDKPASFRYTLEQGQIRREKRDDAPFGGDVQFDAQGALWGWGGLASWTLTGGMRNYDYGFDSRRYIDTNWTVIGSGANAGAAILSRAMLDSAGRPQSHDTIFRIDPKAQRMQTVQWDQKVRDAALSAVGSRAPGAESRFIRLGDGLLWSADRAGLYALSPATGKVVQSGPMTVGGLFFGSRAAGWAIAQEFDRQRGEYFFRVADLTTGLPRYDLTTYAARWAFIVARTANGRLLAIGDDKLVTVFDMKTGQAVQNLTPPSDDEITDAAFSWDGGRLWIYTAPGAQSIDGHLIAWDAPAPLRDPASAAQGSRPDKMRCNEGHTGGCR